MSDVVVTVPKNFTHPAAPGKKGLAAWIGEGDAAGDDPSFTEWSFFIGSRRPSCYAGDRVYIVCEGKLRGYAPLIRVQRYDFLSTFRYALVRGSGAMAIAVTIPEPVKGFRGFRYRWWSRDIEVPFLDWRTP